ncbi:MAG TPA: DsbA family oxidoreductase [Longimicrobiaceae bacterium]|nr:DsbA family oxidoreductase [Longimicrobiaceae bacterium]
MRIDIFSDVVCPWCWIGERRLAAALERRPELEVARRWRPFQLQPGMPAGGIPWEEMVRTKFGGPERARAMFAQVSAAGAPDGIHYAWERIASAPNTVDAHRLILWAAERGREWETAEALFGAYFARGADLGSADDLAAAAAEAGLDPREARAFLAGDGGREEVLRSQREAGELGVTGVPFFVIDGRWGISGAQPLEVFVRALDEAAAAG